MWDMKSRISKAKAAFNKMTIFLQQTETAVLGTMPCMVLKLGHFRKQIRNTQNFLEMVLEKDRKDQSDQMCEK
jgi:hypothetical protein